MAQGIISDPLVYVSKDQCSCISCHSMARSQHTHHHYGHSTTHVAIPQDMAGHINNCIRSCFSRIASDFMPTFTIPPSHTCPPTNIAPPHAHLPPLQYCDHSPLTTPPHHQYHQHHHHQYRHQRQHYHQHGAEDRHHSMHYAQAFSPPPLVHASWESTRETVHGHQRPQPSEIRSDNVTDFDRHQHHPSSHHHARRPHHQHHHSQTHRHTPYSYHNEIPLNRHEHVHNNFEHELQNLALRHWRLRQLEGEYHSYISYTSHLPWHHRPSRGVPVEIQRHDFVPPLFREEREVVDQQNASQNNEPKGLSQHELDKLPSYHVTKKTLEEFNESDRCVVCMSEYEVEETLRVLPCAHEFHAPCVDKWLATNPTCPICRASV